MSATRPSSTGQGLGRPDITRWRSGNTGTPGVWRFSGRRPGPAAAICALIHGNEFCGAWALAGLLERLHDGAVLERGQLTLALCNLAAFDRFDEQVPDACRFVEEDMNRVWSAARLGDGATHERRRAAELLPWLADADLLLDLHSMHEPGTPLLLTGPLPRHISLVRDLRLAGHVVVDAGHAEGVRLRDHGCWGDASSTARALLVECGWHGDPSSRAVALDAVARLLLHAGLMRPDVVPPEWLLIEPSASWKLEVTDAIQARSMRFRFLRAFANLECIGPCGTTIADNDGEPVLTPYDDCVLVMPSLRQLRAGVTVVRLARRMAL